MLTGLADRLVTGGDGFLMGVFAVWTVGGGVGFTSVAAGREGTVELAAGFSSGTRLGRLVTGGVGLVMVGTAFAGWTVGGGVGFTSVTAG